MSDRMHNAPTPEGEFFESGRFAGLSVLLGVVAFVALALCGAGAAIDPKQFSFSCRSANRRSLGIRSTCWAKSDLVICGWGSR